DRTTEIPGRVNQGGSIDNRWSDGSASAQSVDDLGIDGSLDWRLKALLKYGRKLALYEHAILLASPLIPTHLPKTKARLVRKMRQRLIGKQSRLRVAVGRVVLPREEDHSPVVRLLLLLGCFERLLDDVPKVPAAPSAP